MIAAEFEQRTNQVCKDEMFMEDKVEVASRVNGDE